MAALATIPALSIGSPASSLLGLRDSLSLPSPHRFSGGRKFHHPIGLKTIGLLWITRFPLGAALKPKASLRTVTGATSESPPRPS
jgi:hypothetical protein